MDWLGAPGDPFNLAVFRIVWFSGVLYLGNPWRFARWAELPPELISPPIGVPVWLAELALSPGAARVATGLVVVACISAAVGFFARTSAWVVAIVGTYLFALPQLFHKVDHWHHLVLVSALLAASPCGDVLSIDALRRARRGELRLQPRPAYGFVLRSTWLLLGLIYFFPGLWKLAVFQLDLLDGTNLRYQLWNQWLSVGEYLPALRPDQIPLALAVMGVGVVVLEIGLLPAMFSSRWRGRFALAGIAFHLLVYVFMRIRFFALIPAYAAIPDWRSLALRLVRRVRGSGAAPPQLGALRLSCDIFAAPESSVRQTDDAQDGQPASRVSPVSGAVAGVILISMLLTGSMRILDTWPVSMYPTFAFWSRPFATPVELWRIDEDGLAERVPLGDPEVNPLGGNRFGRVAQSILREEDASARSGYADALLAAMNIEPGDYALVMRTRLADPERWSDQGVVLRELDLQTNVLTVHESPTYEELLLR